MKNNFLSTFSLYFILINSVLLLSYSDAFSQRTCQTSETEHYLTHKEKLAGRETFENRLKIHNIQKKEALKNNPLLHKVQKTEATYKIPVIVHVIHNGEPIGEGTNISAAQIYGQIEVLNEDFNLQNPNRSETIQVFKDLAANISIEFIAATIDPNGIPLAEAGIHRTKGCFTQWNTATFDNQAKPTTIWNPNEYLNLWSANFKKRRIWICTISYFFGFRWNRK